jgi:hypothetical protein
MAARYPLTKDLLEKIRDQRDAGTSVIGPKTPHFLQRFVKEVRLEDLERVRDSIDASGSGPSAAAKFVELSKRVLRWGLRQRHRYTDGRLNDEMAVIGVDGG